MLLLFLEAAWIPEAVFDYNALAMQFSTRQILLFTTLVALHFSLRAWWITSQAPNRDGLIPLPLAALVAVYCGWTNRSILVASLFAGFTAMLSSTLIATEIILESDATGFMYTHPSAEYVGDIVLNVIAILFVSVLCTLGGAVFAMITRDIRTLL